MFGVYMHAGSCLSFFDGGCCGGHQRKTRKLLTPSEQEVLDCSGAGTCKGGDPYRAFDHAISPGLALDQHGNPPYYPAYVAEKKKCRFNPVRAHIYIV